MLNTLTGNPFSRRKPVDAQPGLFLRRTCRLLTRPVSSSDEWTVHSRQSVFRHACRRGKAITAHLWQLCPRGSSRPQACLCPTPSSQGQRVPHRPAPPNEKGVSMREVGRRGWWRTVTAREEHERDPACGWRTSAELPRPQHPRVEMHLHPGQLSIPCPSFHPLSFLPSLLRCLLIQLHWLVTTVTWLYHSLLSTVLAMQYFAYLKCPPGPPLKCLSTLQKPSSLPLSSPPTVWQVMWLWVWRHFTYDSSATVSSKCEFILVMLFLSLHVCFFCLPYWTRRWDIVSEMSFFCCGLRVSGGGHHTGSAHPSDLLDISANEWPTVSFLKAEQMMGVFCKVCAIITRYTWTY